MRLSAEGVFADPSVYSGQANPLIEVLKNRGKYRHLWLAAGPLWTDDYLLPEILLTTNFA